MAGGVPGMFHGRNTTGTLFHKRAAQAPRARCRKRYIEHFGYIRRIILPIHGRSVAGMSYA
jgi:2-phosphoglycerate kinase